MQKSKNEAELEHAIENLLALLTRTDPRSEEYAVMTEQLEKLYSIREKPSKDRISPDTLALVIGNLVGIVVIVGHERAHIVTSKAINFVMKLR
ncbi:MAG: hypothetical protein LC687_01565 [Actinobacteria bacterium]|nr:hypothetical protein [Actinomycetota bacterium]